MPIANNPHSHQITGDRAKSMLKKIFIGGIGRSGTTIFLNALYCHPDLYAVPIESKVIVECDGLSDFVSAVTTRYSHTRSLEAYKRLSNVLQVSATSKVKGAYGSAPYLAAYGWQEMFLDEVYENYFEVVENFLASVNVYEHHDKVEIMQSARKFVDDLFGSSAIKLGKSGWVEKTPENIYNINFIRDLYPESYFIILERDPRGIFWSLRKKNWIMPDIDKASKFFLRILKGYIGARSAVSHLDRTILVRLEDFCQNPRKTMKGVTNFLGVDEYEDKDIQQTIDNMRNYWQCTEEEFPWHVMDWKRDMPDSERAKLEASIAREIEILGYTI